MTYIVVKNDRDANAQDRLTPIAQVGQTSPNLIRLNCTLAELAQLPAFSSTHTFSYTYDDYSISAATMVSPFVAPSKTTAYAERVVEATPSGQRALRRGVKVEATDGTIGTVGDLLLDPESGEITHFTLQDGPVWGTQEITVPVSVVQFAGEEVVYLKLDRRAIGSLPAMPVKRRFAQGGQPGGIELIARVFNTPQRARLADSIRQALDEATALAIIDEELDPVVGALLAEEERAQVAGWVLAKVRTLTPQPVRITQDDLYGALASGLLVFLATLPVAAPFLLIDDPWHALRPSNLVCVLLLFGVGYHWAWHTRTNPLVAGLVLTVVGLIMVGITVALGG